MGDGRGSDALQRHIARLKERIFAGDNAACYLEREQILVECDARELTPVAAFAELLGRVGTPVEDDDVFLGRVVEACWPVEMPGPQLEYRSLNTNGHMTLDWATLLTRGLHGIAADAAETARRLDTADARQFAADAAGYAATVEAYARRYAAAARDRAARSADPLARARLLRAAAALETVPCQPATDLFSALQAIWLVHMLTSCYLGSRDFAFGRLDQYLWPYYTRDCAHGVEDDDSVRALLAHFLLKTNEITGTSTWNYQQKPIPCMATKQYLVLGGGDASGREASNRLSTLVLDAALCVRLPEPVLTVRLSATTPESFRNKVAEATIVLQSQLHFYNDDLILPALERQGVPAAEAADYSMIGCCRLDLGGRMDDGLMLSYHYHNTADWLLCALHDAASITSFDELLAQFAHVCTAKVHESVSAAAARLADHQADTACRFESLLLRDCVARGLNYRAGGVRYRPQGHLLGGIATVANSLLAIKRLVYEEQRYTLAQYLAIVDANFAGHEPLLHEVRTRLPKFGNDDPAVDGIAARVGDILLDAFDGCAVPADQVLLTGFYSLNAHHDWGRDLPATPDGRLPGEPVSENQSPTYGTDRHGVTALLSSVARLPLARTVMGGLNVTFSGDITPEKVAALLRTYFSLGGLHVGFTMLDRQTLLEAQQHPDRHRSLCVRLYGYSEYFVALSPEEQQEILTRTAVEV